VVFGRKSANLVFSNPSHADAIRVKVILDRQQNIIGDPSIEAGATGTSIIVDIKYRQVADIETIKTAALTVPNTKLDTYSINPGAPPNVKKRRRNTAIFIFATYGAFIAADSGITIFINDPSILNKTIYQFFPVLTKAAIVSIFPTAAAYLVSKLGK
jgi:hypothetical protein